MALIGGGGHAGNRKMERIFMFVKMICPKVLSVPALVYGHLYFKNLLGKHVANQNRITYVAFLKWENECLCK